MPVIFAAYNKLVQICSRAVVSKSWYLSATEIRLWNAGSKFFTRFVVKNSTP